MIDLETIISACGHITFTDTHGREKAGTGYLISPNHVATCAHVVEDLQGEVDVDFKGNQRSASIAEINPDNDCVILKLSSSIPDAQPLTLGGRCEWKAPWDTYGFPSVARGAGVTMTGIVSNPNAKDDLNKDVLELTSPEVAAGMATSIHGFSGSPVLVNGVVVGHLKRFLSDDKEPHKPAYGKVYATRSHCVLGLLDRAPAEPIPPEGPLSPPQSGDPQSPPPVEPPPVGSEAYDHTKQMIQDLLHKWSEDDMPPDLPELLATESLIQLGEKSAALGILDTMPPSARKDQLRALAFAKMDTPESMDESMDVLMHLKETGDFDPETGSILAEHFKKSWMRGGVKDDLHKCHEMYISSYERTKDPDFGIKAASTALWLGSKSLSSSLAKHVLDDFYIVKTEKTDSKMLAIWGEAFLLVGNVAQAKSCYMDALKHSELAKDNLQIMREQLNQNLSTLGYSRAEFNEVFEWKK